MDTLTEQSNNTDNRAIIRHALELHREVIKLKRQLASCRASEKQLRTQLENVSNTN